MHHGVRPAMILPAILALAALTTTPPAMAAGAGASVHAVAPGTPDAVSWQRLADRLRALDEDGLDPADYGIPSEALAEANPALWQAALRQAAAAALVDLLHGRVREMPGRPDIRRDPGAIPLGPWQAALASAADPAAVIERAALLPPDAAALKAALARARALAALGPWPTVPGSGNDTIEPGTTDPVRVPALRARLAMTDPAIALTLARQRDDPFYDEPLVEAARRFQAAQGLEPDGRVGAITRAALNRSPEVAVRQLRVALDMRRAAAQPGAERRIEVNIPQARLQVMQGDRALLDMAVIVGRPSRATPLLRVRLTAVQFNPPWGVPVRNAREDLLPRFQRNPRAMMEKGFRVYGVVEGERVEIDPTTIDWRSVNPERFPYVIRQDAGDGNALGRIKFIMPNGEDIFMHDTPDRHLFRRPDRAFSSGCIRLEKPMELLDIALEGTPGWDRARANRALETRQTSAVSVARTLPVRLHYTSVVVEREGEVRMRPDIYGLDEAYARAMTAGRPRVAAAAGR